MSSNPEKLDLAVIVLAFNEARHISSCLEAIGNNLGPARLLLIDSESTDGTRELAATVPNVEIHIQPWLGYTKQRNTAMELVDSAWVLFVDADEILPPELAKEIRQIVHSGQANGAELRRINYFLGEPIRCATEHIPRLVRRGKGVWEGDLVHERLAINGKIARTRHALLHDAWPTIDVFFRKHDQYAQLMAMSKREAYAGIGLLFKPLGAPIKFLLLKGGILDGWRGWLYAFAYTLYSLRKAVLRIAYARNHVENASENEPT